LPGTPHRIIIIKNTLKLDEMYVSKAIWEEIKGRENIFATGEWGSIKFNPSGQLMNTI